MTLSDCIRKHGLSMREVGNNFCVQGPTYPADLWYCSDYGISSISADCALLVKYPDK